MSPQQIYEPATALRQWLHPGELVYLVKRRTSRSGAQTIDFKVLTPHGHIMPIGVVVADLLNRPYDAQYRGVFIGKHTPAAILNELSSALFGKPDELHAEWL